MKTVIVAFSAVLFSGCGTVCNLAGGVTHPDQEPRVYGGVLRDLEFWEEVDEAPSSSAPLLGSPHGDGRGAVLLLAALGALAVGEPALSFVGDTATLPLTIYLQNKRIAAEQSDAATPADAPLAGVFLGKPQPIESDAPGQEIDGASWKRLDATATDR